MLYWINSFNSAACLLASDIADLASGKAAYFITCQLLNIPDPESFATAYEHWFVVLQLLSSTEYSQEFPSIFLNEDVIELFMKPEFSVVFYFFAFLKYFFKEGMAPIIAMDENPRMARHITDPSPLRKSMLTLEDLESTKQPQGFRRIKKEKKKRSIRKTQRLTPTQKAGLSLLQSQFKHTRRDIALTGESPRKRVGGGYAYKSPIIVAAELRGKMKRGNRRWQRPKHPPLPHEYPVTSAFNVSSRDVLATDDAEITQQIVDEYHITKLRKQKEQFGYLKQFNKTVSNLNRTPAEKLNRPEKLNRADKKTKTREKARIRFDEEGLTATMKETQHKRSVIDNIQSVFEKDALKKTKSTISLGSGPARRMHVVEDKRPDNLTSLTNEEQDLVRWFIVRSEGRALQLDHMPYREDFAHDFSQGLLLNMFLMNAYRLVDIKGTYKAPKTRGQRMINIRKGFEILKKDKKFRSEHVFNSDGMVDGDTDTVFGLLYDIQRHFEKTFGGAKRRRRRKTEEMESLKTEFASTTVEASDNIYLSVLTKPLVVDMCDENERKDIRLTLIKCGMSLLSERHMAELPILMDPLRNGKVVLDLLRLHRVQVKDLKVLRSIKDVKTRYNRCFKAIRQSDLQIPTSLLSVDELISGGCIWELLRCLVRNVEPHKRWIKGYPGSTCVRLESIEELMNSISETLNVHSLFIDWGDISVGMIVPIYNSLSKMEVRHINQLVEKLQIEKIIAIGDYDKMLQGDLVLIVRTIARIRQAFSATTRLVAPKMNVANIEKKKDVVSSIENRLQTLVDSIRTSKSSKNGWLSKTTTTIVPSTPRMPAVLGASMVIPKTPNSTHVGNAPNHEMAEWLRGLGMRVTPYAVESGRHWANGTLLCDLANRLTPTLHLSYVESPECRAHCMYNIETALNALKLPDSLCDDSTIYSILEGDGEVVVRVLQLLYRRFKKEHM
ncbi:hypothetical protein PCE1_001773 [Barthelona sp. PCE]